jgi:hypothetical protein
MTAKRQMIFALAGLVVVAAVVVAVIKGRVGGGNYPNHYVADSPFGRRDLAATLTAEGHMTHAVETEGDADEGFVVDGKDCVPRVSYWREEEETVQRLRACNVKWIRCVSGGKAEAPW